jgi:hypothetical protein
VAQAITTIVLTASDYSNSFVNMAEKLVNAVEYIYPKEEPKPPATPDEPKSQPLVLPNDLPSAPGATPSSAAEPPPVESKPEAFVLVPLVEDDERAAVLDVRPQAKLPAQEAKEASADETVAPKAPDNPNELLEGPTRPDWRSLAQQVIKDLKDYIFNIATNAFGTIFGLASGVFFVIIFVMFMLLGRNPYTEHSQVYADVVQKIRRYVGIKVAMSAVTGVLVWVTLTLLGLKLAGVFGILAFLLDFIPSIGPLIVTLLPIPIAVVQFQSSPWLIVLVVAIPGAIQNLLGNIIEPKLQGEGLNLHPVTILLALSFWGLLWGIVGMFLAAPITAALRIVLMQSDTLRPIANLLAGDFTKPRKSRRVTQRTCGAPGSVEHRMSPALRPHR